MMEYAFVDSCDDVKTLRAVLRKLRDGEWGRFPHLEKHTEDRLLGLLPQKERNRILRLRSKVTPGEVHEAQAELAAWQEAMRATAPDGAAASAGGSSGGTKLPPPRGRAADAGSARGEDGGREEDDDEDEEQHGDGGGGGGGGGGHHASGGSADASAAPSRFAARERLSGYDFPAWEKFDVDAAMAEIDDVDSAGAAEKTRLVEDAIEAEKRREAGRVRRRNAELASLKEEMRFDSLTPSERSFLANREKQKGNECYRAGETEEAGLCYTKALALLSDHLDGERTLDDPRVDGAKQAAIVYCNRAMARIKLGTLDGAERDATEAIRLDPTYVKAFSRRGMVRHKRGKYTQAIQDFERAMQMEPSNKDLAKLLLLSKRKRDEVGGADRAAVRDSTSTVGTAAPPAAVTGRVSAARVVQDLEVDAAWPAEAIVEASRLKEWSGEAPALASADEGPARSASAFHRVQIVEDDSSSDEGGEEAPAVEAEESFTKLTIEESAESGGDSPSSRESAGGRFTRIDITEEEVPSPLSRRCAADLKAEGARKMAAQDFLGAFDAFQDAIEAASDSEAALTPGLHANCAAALLAAGEHQSAADRCGVALGAIASAVSSSGLEECDAARMKAKVLMRRASALEALQRAAEAVCDLEGVVALDADFPGAAEALSRLSAGKEGQGQGEGDGEGKGKIEDEGEGEGGAGRGWRLKGEGGDSPGAASEDRLGYWKQRFSKETAEKAKPHVERRAASDALKQRGNDALRTGDAVAAEGLYTEAVVVDNTNVAAYNNRAQARLSTGDFSGAAGDARRVLRSDAGCPKARLRLAKALCGLGGDERAAEARALVDALIAENGAKRVLLELQERLGAADRGEGARQSRGEEKKCDGNRRMAEGDYAGAVASYTEALSLDAGNLAAKNNRSQAYLKLGRFAECIQDATEVLSRDAFNAKALYRRAHARAHGAADGDASALRAAEDDLGELLRLQPDNPRASSLRREVAARKASGARADPAAKAPAPPLAPEAKAPSVAERAPAPAAARGAARSASEVNERVGAAMRRAAELKGRSVSVVPEPPSSLYEFERTWRGIKHDADASARYFAGFKAKHLKRVIRESTDGEVYSSLFQAAAALDSAKGLPLLQGLARTDAFSMAKLMFTEDDRDCLRAALRKAGAADENGAKLARKLRKAYGL